MPAQTHLSAFQLPASHLFAWLPFLFLFHHFGLFDFLLLLWTVILTPLAFFAAVAGRRLAVVPDGGRQNVMSAW